MKKTALLSVYDKTGIVEFARELVELGYDILSTGGTLKKLSEAEIPVKSVSSVTGFPEILDGRVKTLHPVIHGGLLARRDKEEHMSTIKEHGIKSIDLVAINLYPFKETISREGCTFEEAIENIDIGGPTMLRSAAKNFESVITVVDINDYDEVIERLKADDVTREFKMKLQLKVYRTTSNYDAMISTYLSEIVGDDFGDYYTNPLSKKAELRYGENAGQKAALYVNELEGLGIAKAEVLHGKAMSYNNYLDANAAVNLVKEFEEPACVCLKHTNPCGVSEHEDIFVAYQNAFNCDPVSIFGGIIALNREVDERVAEEISKIFIEVLIAPSYSDKAMEILTRKKNIRLIALNPYDIKQKHEIRSITGGVLVQETDNSLYEELEILTEKAPTDREIADMEFAMKVVKHSKSNAIVLAKDKITKGIGQGQVSRVFASKNAVSFSLSSLEGAVMASDAFFPFPDAMEEALNAGVTAVIQPAGSKNDEAVIESANRYGVSIVATHQRHFKH